MLTKSLLVPELTVFNSINRCTSEFISDSVLLIKEFKKKWLVTLNLLCFFKMLQSLWILPYVHMHARLHSSEKLNWLGIVHMSPLPVQPKGTWIQQLKLEPKVYLSKMSYSVYFHLADASDKTEVE